SGGAVNKKFDTDGGSLSATVTVNGQVPVLPAASVAVPTTCVTPIGNDEPEAMLVATLTGAGHVSVAVGRAKLTGAEQVPGAVFVTIDAGHTIDGGSLSTTVTVNGQVALLPAASVAVPTTCVTPIGNDEPEAMLVATPTGAGHASVAVGRAKLTGAAQVPGAVFVAIGAGHTIDGGSLSTTVTVNGQVAL